MKKPKTDPVEAVLSQPARKKTLNRVQLFPEAFRTTGCILTSAKIAGISPKMHYRKLESDPAYQKAFARVKEELADVIEGELFRRALLGEKEFVFYKGKKVATIMRKSETLLMFIARGAMPNKYREHTSVEHSGNINLVERLTPRQSELRRIPVFIERAIRNCGCDQTYVLMLQGRAYA